MRNNNGAVVRKLTRRTLRANNRRNFFIAAAIALTAFMMASVFSVGISYYHSVQLMPFRSEGIHSHVGFTRPTPQQLAQLETLPYVRKFGAHHIVGGVQLAGFYSDMLMVYASEAHWRYMNLPTFTRFEGAFATAENELMLSRAMLAQMGIDAPYIGMVLPLAFTVYGAADAQTQDFVLAAMYTEFVSARAGAFTPVMVSRAFAARHGRIGYDSMNINVLFTSQARALDYVQQLVRDLQLGDDQPYVAHPALTFYSGINTTVMYVAIGSTIAFLMFTGFLLIYNVMYVSVSKDVRFYGLLKTLGTTPRQLRRLVYGQVLALYAVALPVGLGAAAVASLGIVPAFLTEIATGGVVSFSPIIYAGGALFALFTAMLGAYTAAKKAARIAPIEAVKFAGDLMISGRARISAKGKPLRMAWRNVFRERKRAVVVLTSLFMGIAVFMLTMTIVAGFDIDNEIDYWYTHDFVLSTMDLGLLDESFIAQVAAIPGVTEVQEQLATGGRILGLDQLADIRGFDPAWLLAIDPTLAYTLDIPAFQRGEILLANLRTPNAPPPELPPIIQVEIYNVDAPLTLAVAGTLERIHTLGGITWHFGSSLNLIISNTFLREIKPEVEAVHLGVNVQPGQDAAVHAYLREILGTNRDVVSRYEARQAMEEGLLMLTVLGSALSAILGLIGIFNFINVMSVGLLVRKREFAALESIGMSKKQLRNMITCEGLIYCLLSIAAAATIGTALSYGIMSLLINFAGSQFPRFIFPAVPIIAVYVLVAAVCAITPLLAYRSINRATLVERLREAE